MWIYQCNYRNDNLGRGRSRSRERHYSSNLEEMIEAVVVDQDQVSELVLTEIELDIFNVGNMSILLKTVQIQKQKESQNKTANV